MSAIEVKVPDIGDFKDVPVIEIPVKPGDVVKADDPLIVLESDKASMEVPSPAAGKVLEILVKLGDKVGEGSLILRLEAEGAAAGPAAAAPAAAAPAAKTEQVPVAVTDLDAGKLTNPAPIVGSTNYPPNIAADFSNVHASPSVRRLARELDLDLTKVPGTGDKGRVTKEDVKAFLGGGKAAAPAGVSGGSGIPEIPTIDFSKFGPIEEKPLSRIKKLSGPFLHRSWLNVPAVTQHDEADITEIEAYRKELDDAAKTDKKKPFRVSLLPFLMKACVSILKSFPGLQLVAEPGQGWADLQEILQYRHRRRHAGRARRAGHQGRRPQGRTGNFARAWRDLGQGARRQAVTGRNVGRDFHHLLARRHWRHRLHAHRQRAGSGDPRRRALENGAGVERRGVQAPADAAAVTVLRPSRDRRGGGGAVLSPSRAFARRRAQARPLNHRGRS